MDDGIRRRMKRALDMKGLDPYAVSKEAGLNRNYLWESFDLKRRKGSLDGYKKIADTIGLNYSWLLQAEGEPFCPTASMRALDRTLVIAALEVLLERIGLDVAMARDGALKVLDIVERPPNDSSSTDKLSRVRSGILGALRVYERLPNQ